MSPQSAIYKRRKAAARSTLVLSIIYLQYLSQLILFRDEMGTRSGGRPAPAPSPGWYRPAGTCTIALQNGAVTTSYIIPIYAALLRCMVVLQERIDLNNILRSIKTKKKVSVCEKSFKERTLQQCSLFFFFVSFSVKRS